MARVLVVEDDEDLRGLVTVRLRGGGHQVLAAADAPGAVALVAERGAPDIAVLDVGLPGMNGMELLTTLRAGPGLAQLPAVFLTARVQEADVQRGRALGATYLTKPFVAAALLTAVQRLLDVGQEGGDGGW